MDYIEGRSVEECWDDLSEKQRANIIMQVASMITTLQSVQVIQDPGPVDCNRCLCRGCWFTDMGAGPFGTIREMEDWFNRKLAICQHFKQAPATVSPFRFEKLVLTHQDIAPRNLILGPSGMVWLIDWGDAGIYPLGFEVASLVKRRHSAPQFTDLLLEQVPKHEHLVEQLGWHNVIDHLTDRITYPIAFAPSNMLKVNFRNNYIVTWLHSERRSIASDAVRNPPKIPNFAPKYLNNLCVRKSETLINYRKYSGIEILKF
jgi:hypothetical protein